LSSAFLENFKKRFQAALPAIIFHLSVSFCIVFFSRSKSTGKRNVHRNPVRSVLQQHSIPYGEIGRGITSASVFLCKPFRQCDIVTMLENHLGALFVYAPFQLETEPLDDSLDVPASVAALPEELLRRFETTLISTKMDEVESIVEEIREINYALAKRLGAMVHDFAYDEILELIGRVPQS
jgi:hypothetical protein